MRVCTWLTTSLLTAVTSNGVDLTGLLGDIKEDWRSWGRKSPSGVRGGAPVGGPPEAEAFCETTHNICIKIQQTTVAVTLADILNNITSKILEGTLPWMSPLHKYWGDMSPCPIGIDAPGHKARLTFLLNQACLPQPSPQD